MENIDFSKSSPYVVAAAVIVNEYAPKRLLIWNLRYPTTWRCFGCQCQWAGANASAKANANANAKANAKTNARAHANADANAKANANAKVNETFC